jgi:glycosyltransferase involved in cell wall biosynthesis
MQKKKASNDNDMNPKVYKSSPKTIGVTIPIYNSELYLQQAIESILNQTSLPDEILLFIHDSSDKSEFIAKHYESHCRIIISNEGYSMSEAWNKSILLSECDYIVMLHSDDLLENDIVSFYRKMIDKNPFDVGFTRSYICDVNGNVQKTNISEDDAIIKNREDYILKTMDGFFPGCSGVCVKKSFFERNSYETQLNVYTDIEWFSRVGWYGKVLGFSFVGAKYRVHQNSTFRTSKLKKSSQDILNWFHLYLQNKIVPPIDYKTKYERFLFSKVIQHFGFNLWSFTINHGNHDLDDWTFPLLTILQKQKNEQCKYFSPYLIFVMQLFVQKGFYRAISIYLYKIYHLYLFLPHKVHSILTN